MWRQGAGRLYPGVAPNALPPPDSLKTLSLKPDAIALTVLFPSLFSYFKTSRPAAGRPNFSEALIVGIKTLDPTLAKLTVAARESRC